MTSPYRNPGPQQIAQHVLDYMALHGRAPDYDTMKEIVEYRSPNPQLRFSNAVEILLNTWIKKGGQ